MAKENGASGINVKKALFAEFAVLAKALAHGNRLELLELVAQGERSVEALAKVAGLSIANASQHLLKLRRAGLVLAQKRGPYVYYRLRDEAVISLLGNLRALAEDNLAEVDRLVEHFLHDKDELEPVSSQELLARSRQGQVTVLDVRPPEEFAAGHLPGAVNIPLHELESRLAELPRRRQVVAYCRGPYCVLAFEAVATLRRQGFEARRLEQGLPEWRRDGLPVESHPG